MTECVVDEQFRPEEPPKILATEILSNYFDDMEPREKPKAAPGTPLPPHCFTYS